MFFFYSVVTTCNGVARFVCCDSIKLFYLEYFRIFGFIERKKQSINSDSGKQSTDFKLQFRTKKP